MKIFSNFIPQSRYEKRLGEIERFKSKQITLFNDYPVSKIEDLHLNPVHILLVNEPNEFFIIYNYAVELNKL